MPENAKSPEQLIALGSFDKKAVLILQFLKAQRAGLRNQFYK